MFTVEGWPSIDDWTVDHKEEIVEAITEALTRAAEWGLRRVPAFGFMENGMVMEIVAGNLADQLQTCLAFYERQEAWDKCITLRDIRTKIKNLDRPIEYKKPTRRKHAKQKQEPD